MDYITVKNGTVGFSNTVESWFGADLVIQVDAVNDLLMVVKDRNSNILHVQVKKLKYISEMYQPYMPVDMNTGTSPSIFDQVCLAIADYDGDFYDAFTRVFL